VSRHRHTAFLQVYLPGRAGLDVKSPAARPHVDTDAGRKPGCRRGCPDSYWASSSSTSRCSVAAIVANPRSGSRAVMVAASNRSASTAVSRIRFNNRFSRASAASEPASDIVSSQIRPPQAVIWNQRRGRHYEAESRPRPTRAAGPWPAASFSAPSGRWCGGLCTHRSQARRRWRRGGPHQASRHPVSRRSRRLYCNWSGAGSGSRHPARRRRVDRVGPGAAGGWHARELRQLRRAARSKACLPRRRAAATAPSGRVFGSSRRSSVSPARRRTNVPAARPCCGHGRHGQSASGRRFRSLMSTTAGPEEPRLGRGR
jgi:hypothetical protein